MSRAHAQLIKGKLTDLHPTQITVGKTEVALKRQAWEALGKKARADTLESHWFPTILGPNNRHYIVDHHHFGLALHEEGVKNVWLMVLKDLSWLDPNVFWNMMHHHQWTHPYDCDGIRRDFDDIPGHIDELQDDPYRSLAGEVRCAGGYAKDVTPFSEFLWADFFRTRITIDRIQDNFDKALAKGIKLARSQEARYLPGWSGVFESK
ncbi:MAG TPA: ParB-like protein [Burkholderiaceae bacterium]|jgi:hypothetical protein|nr:ParB-like protein [Burkholderiaceae bacterium]